MIITIRWACLFSWSWLCHWGCIRAQSGFLDQKGDPRGLLCFPASFSSHDGSRGAKPSFQDPPLPPAPGALARSSVSFWDPYFPYPFLPSCLRFGWHLQPRIFFLPSPQTSVILDAWFPSLCPRNRFLNTGRQPPSPLTADVHGTYHAIWPFITLGHGLEPAPTGQQVSLCGPSPVLRSAMAPRGLEIFRVHTGSVYSTANPANQGSSSLPVSRAGC